MNVGDLGLNDVRDFFSSVKGGRRAGEDIEIDQILNALNYWIIWSLRLTHYQLSASAVFEIWIWAHDR